MFGLPLLSTVALGSLLISKTNAHGYSSDPIARQVKCNEDGGYWYPTDGSNIPNNACRGAFLESKAHDEAGTYQFQQINEYAANVPGYGDIENVKKEIKDGTLCAAGDHKKYGMDFVSGDWHKNTINIDHKGIFHTTVKYCATAVHNPSYWEAYITNEDFDSSKSKLTWHDLTFIKKIGNVEPKSGQIEHCGASKYYEFEIDNAYAPLSGPVNNAVLYLRWQRVDSGKEGFYNCLDVNFVKQDGVGVIDKGQKITLTLTDQLRAELAEQLCKSVNEFTAEKGNNFAQEANAVPPVEMSNAIDQTADYTTTEVPANVNQADNEVEVAGESNHITDEL